VNPVPFAVSERVNVVACEATALLIVNVVMFALFATLNTDPLFRLIVSTLLLIVGAVKVSVIVPLATTLPDESTDNRSELPGEFTPTDHLPRMNPRSRITVFTTIPIGLNLDFCAAEGLFVQTPVIVQSPR
jgi:hypothetical protein